MQHRLLTVGIAGASAFAATLAFAAPPASADYAPNSHDVVGVGSDTVQYAGDFVADGSYTGSAGYNSAINKYRVVNYDATPDDNARLAYGPQGSGPSCGPGYGGTAGSGNGSGNHSDTPCLLNPTVVLRAGTKPVQRPNGSGDGAKAFAGDTASGRNWLTYSRASSNQDATLPSTSFDVMKIGTDPLDLLTGTTTNAVPLDANLLASIYTCAITNWSQLSNVGIAGDGSAIFSATATYTKHYYNAFDLANGYTPVAGDVELTSGTIIPIIPQVGSGTRSSWEALIGVTDAQVVTATGTGAGQCVQVGEENDPTAIAAQGANSVNAITPMSGGRLNLFQGTLGSGASSNKGGYFQDPSCKIVAAGTPSGGTGDCQAGNDGSGGTGTGTAVRVTGQPVTPSVSLQTTGTPPDSTSAAPTAVVSTLALATRNLFIYFRKADVDSITAWQPGTLLNAVRTLFYNPCDPSTSNNGSAGVDGGSGPNGNGFTAADCITISGTLYGPGGQPFYAKSAGTTDISAAGINPSVGVSTTGAGGPFN